MSANPSIIDYMTLPVLKEVRCSQRCTAVLGNPARPGRAGSQWVTASSHCVLWRVAIPLASAVMTAASAREGAVRRSTWGRLSLIPCAMLAAAKDASCLHESYQEN